MSTSNYESQDPTVGKADAFKPAYELLNERDVAQGEDTSEQKQKPEPKITEVDKQHGAQRLESGYLPEISEGRWFIDEGAEVGEITGEAAILRITGAKVDKISGDAWVLDVYHSEIGEITDNVHIHTICGDERFIKEPTDESHMSRIGKIGGEAKVKWANNSVVIDNLTDQAFIENTFNNVTIGTADKRAEISILDRGCYVENVLDDAVVHFDWQKHGNPHKIEGDPVALAAAVEARKRIHNSDPLGDKFDTWASAWIKKFHML